MASPGTASLRRCETSLRKSSLRLFQSLPCHCSVVPHNALLVRFYASLRFTSCVAYQCFAIASPIDATRCFCFSLPHHAPLLLCALACVNACWRVLARVASARRFYAFPSPCNPKHYLAFAFPLFSFGLQCSTVLLRCL